MNDWYLFRRVAWGLMIISVGFWGWDGFGWVRVELRLDLSAERGLVGRPDGRGGRDRDGDGEWMRFVKRP